MLVRSTACTRRPETGDLARLLKATDIFTYSECGWFCVGAYEGGQRTINLHFNSEDDWNRMIGLSGYRLSGGVLVKDASAARRSVDRYIDTGYRSSWR